MVLLLVCSWGCQSKTAATPAPKPPPSRSAQRESSDSAKDPYVITHVGHGSVFNHEGAIAEVTLKHLAHTQADHLRQLEAYAKKRGVHLPYRDPRQEGDIFAQGIVIDELIKQLVSSPLYACSTAVGVTGARLHAEVALYVNGQEVDAKVIEDTKMTEFSLSTPLSDKDKVTAIQRVANVDSPLSKEVTVRSHSSVYGQLPAPSIDPNITHVCAQRIAVSHVEGAQLRFYVNGQEVNQGQGNSVGRTWMASKRSGTAQGASLR